MFGSLRNEAFQRGSAAWREARLKADETRIELTRRTALARQPRPQGVSGPSMRRLLGELGSLATLRGRVQPAEPVQLAAAPRPVMLLPGFGSHPARMAPLRRALEAAGHVVIDWGLGFNIGPTPENFAFLIARVVHLARVEGMPVTLVGWSLGGLFARELAKARPDAVHGVITMGTPFSGNRRANNAWRAYQFVTDHSVDEPPIPCDFATKPPVRTVALWSPRDGVVSPRSSCGWPGERDSAVAVRCSHLGFARDPRVIAEVLRQIEIEGPE